MDPILLALLGLAGMFALIALHVPVGVSMEVRPVRMPDGSVVFWAGALSRAVTR